MQLLRISQIPIKIEINKIPAKFEMKCNRPKLRIERQKNGLQVNREPIRFELDNTKFFDSLGYKTIRSLAKELEGISYQSALAGIARYASEGNMMLENKDAIREIIFQRFNKTIESNIGFIPDKPDISWSGGNINISYTPDELIFEWDVQNPEIVYIPPSVSYRVKRWPQVIIEYIGGPNYIKSNKNKISLSI